MEETMKACMLFLLGNIIIGCYVQAQKCNVPLEALISGDVYNVSESQITVGSEQNNNTIANISLPNGTGYCVDSEMMEQITIIPDVSVNFTTQFLIMNFSISGLNDDREGGYIERLRIVSDDDGVISEIIEVNLTSDNFSEVQNEQLSTPIFARQLRILPYQWSSNPLCIRVEVYGCPANQSTGPATEKDVNFLVVEAVVPALGLVCIIVVSVVIGVLCYKALKTNGNEGKILRNPSVRQDLLEDDSQDRTLKVVNNSLYHSSSVVKPRLKKPEAGVTKSIGRSYETIDMSTGVEAPSANHQPSSTNGNTTSYSSVAFTATNEDMTDEPQPTKRNQYRGNYVEVHESGGAEQNMVQKSQGSNMKQLYPQYEACSFNNGDGGVLSSMDESQGPDHFAV